MPAPRFDDELGVTPDVAAARAVAAAPGSAIAPPVPDAPQVPDSPEVPEAPQVPEASQVHAAPARPALKRGVEAALVAAFAVALAAWELGLWRANLSLPLRYAPLDDTKFYLMLVKGIIEHGSYLSNPVLGWPFGQHLADYPQGADNLNLLIIRGIATFSSDPALVVNVFYLLTFGLTAGAAHLVLRSQEVSAPAAAVSAVLFSLLPYHFFRGESHLLLSAYYAVPLAAYLFLAVLEGRPLFTRRAVASSRSRSWASWASRRTLSTVGLCVVVGSDNLYYATFAVVLLTASLLVSLVRRHARPAGSGALALALIVLTLAANLAPTLVYRAQHGGNPRLTRTATSDEASNAGLSLRLTNLLLPVPNGRITPFAHLAAHYDRAISPGYCEGCYASLGTVGTIGLVWLGLGALGTLVGAGAWYGSRRRFRHAAVGAGTAFVVGTVGGVSSLIEFYVTPDIRGWNRISLFVAFFSLFAAALLLDSIVTRARCWRRGRALAGVTLGAVLAFGVYDQSSASSASDHRPGDREYRSDATFVSQIQARLPPGAAVFQLPYVPFPEGYPDTPCCGTVATYATKYEPLRGYLHSSTLRWSYGAIKGRPADWPAALAGQPLSLLLASVVSAGFDGLWFDPAGLTPVRGQRVESALRSLLGQPPLESPDHDLWFFDLRPYAARLRRAASPTRLALLRVRTLYPLRSVCAQGGLKLINPSGLPRPAVLSAHQADGSAHRQALTLAPGTSYVAVPNAATARGRVLSATVTDERSDRLARGGGAPGRVVVGLTGPGCPG